MLPISLNDQQRSNTTQAVDQTVRLMARSDSSVLTVSPQVWTQKQSLGASKQVEECVGIPTLTRHTLERVSVLKLAVQIANVSNGIAC